MTFENISAQDILEELEAMWRVVDSSDMQAAALTELRRQKEMNRIMHERHRGLKNCIVELNRRIYGLQKRLEEKKGGRINDTETKAVC